MGVDVEKNSQIQRFVDMKQNTLNSFADLYTLLNVAHLSKNGRANKKGKFSTLKIAKGKKQQINP